MQAQNFISEVTNTKTHIDIEMRTLSHKLMRTLEKVRWEIIKSYKNKDYFNSRRR